ncbi:MAG TPA: aminopeptidase [Candidatus Nitrosocosmicus sp.]|nr:aminopeptidase [Candidatus Nitrosocosmicus sp.]
MKDVRVGKLADVLLGHSLNVREGENVVIRAGYLAKPLIDEFYKRSIDKGANTVVHILFDEHKKYLMENATEKQLDNSNELYRDIYKKADAVLVIEAPENTKHLTNVDPRKNMVYNKNLSPVLKEIMEKRWVLTNYPVEAFAQDAGMSLEEYEDFLFDAVLVDYKKMDQDMDKVLNIFDAADTVRIVGRETDLTFSIKGRKGTKCSGQNNVPDGEVFYAPVTNSANGHIYYEFPAIRYGNQVDGVRLEFKDGKIISAKADRNEKFLNQMLDTDDGSRYLGEFGIGLNYGIKKFIKNILFDEKIGGTIHLAAGNAYEGSGGDNRSALHWDMIKELRDVGEIYADGKLVQKNGIYL